jgi:hypothetical protein
MKCIFQSRPYFKYMVYFEKCISLVFLSSYFENAWSKLQKSIHIFNKTHSKISIPAPSDEGCTVSKPRRLQFEGVVT